MTTADHEGHLRQCKTDSTAPRVSREQAQDLAYRGIIPRELGLTILKDPSAVTQPQQTENYATRDQSENRSNEEEAFNKRRNSLAPAIRVQHLLILDFGRLDLSICNGLPFG